MKNRLPAGAVQDPFNLARFVEAQDPVYSRVLAELERGTKQSHWMWFVFPQAVGLGRSEMARHYAIHSAAEGHAYLDHPLLGSRLMQCTRILLTHRHRDAETIFGPIDALRLRSSMTLFDALAGADNPFAACLATFFGGQGDPATLAFLKH